MALAIPAKAGRRKDFGQVAETSDKQSAEKLRAKLLQEKLHEHAGLIPSKSFREAAQRNLGGHLAEFIGDLKSKGLNGQYINEFQNRLKLLMDECRWQLPQDMTADSFVAWRSSSKDRSAKTLNEYLTCAKGFANWLVAQGRDCRQSTSLDQA